VIRIATTCLLLLAACGMERSSRDGELDDEAKLGFELPVLTNRESPVVYPANLFRQEVQASVILRLFVTETGVVVPESTRVAESSGYPALDSAALAGVSSMTFAPARQNGDPVSTLFLQPVQFRHPASAESGDQP
jgi:TonB family protein